MREIKFRGLRHFDNGKTEWVYGFYVERWNNKRCIAQYAPKERPDEKDCYEDHWDIFVDVYEDSIGQFTGMYDKNDTEIYEGDIITLDTWAGKHVVMFVDGAFCFKEIGVDTSYCNDIHYTHHAGRKQALVIGNIHDKKNEECKKRVPPKELEEK